MPIGALEDAQIASLAGAECEVEYTQAQARPGRISWARLFERVFDIDIQRYIVNRRPQAGSRSASPRVRCGQSVQGPTGDRRVMPSHPLQCRCSRLTGFVGEPAKAVHGVCYCTDCQSFAHFLGKAQDILDGAGGTEVVMTDPRHVTFTQGLDVLACMSLSPKGLLRWYASCCNTPIGNTLRNRRIAYVGLVHSCLGDSATLQRSFGPLRIRANTGSAYGRVESTPMRNLGGLVRAGAWVARARVSGSYRRTPFFDPASGDPVAWPVTITRSERERLRHATEAMHDR